AGTGAAGLGHAAAQAGTHGAAAASQAFGHAGHAAGQVIGDSAAHATQAAHAAGHQGLTHSAQHAVDHTRRAARWSRHGAKLLHGKALVATVATVTVVTTTTAVVAATAGGSSSPQASVAQTEEQALHAFGRGDNAAICNVMGKQMLQLYGGKSGCLTLMASANGFLNALGGSLSDQRAAARDATVDASKVRVNGSTAVVPAAAVHWKANTIKVAGQDIGSAEIEDTAWVKEGGRWVLAMPADMPSDMPTSLFPSGIPTDLFPSSLPTDFLNNGDVPSVSIPSGLFGSLPSDSATS
ncbi:MAG: nuclear transport factor 2 family protein, partial [Catenulispora sp.]|nr:nuclear transport factor 2 family protein [Catenulispora sp.]